MADQSTPHAEGEGLLRTAQPCECGAKVGDASGPLDWSDIDEGRDRFCIYCWACGNSGPRADTLPEAVAAWNECGQSPTFDRLLDMVTEAAGQGKIQPNSPMWNVIKAYADTYALSLRTPPAPEREGDNASETTSDLVYAVAGIVDPDSRRKMARPGRIQNAMERAKAIIKLVRASYPAAPEGEQDEVGAAEREVGRWVYRRIERLMDAKPDTPEAAELAFLAAVVENVEEYGEEACADHPLTAPPLRSEGAPSVGEGGGEWAEARREAWLTIKGACTDSRALFENGWVMGRANAMVAAPALLAERDEAVVQHARAEAALAELQEVKQACAPLIARIEKFDAETPSSSGRSRSDDLMFGLGTDLRALLSALSSAKGVER